MSTRTVPNVDEDRDSALVVSQVLSRPDREVETAAAPSADAGTEVLTGHAPATQHLLKDLAHAAMTLAPVLLVGESGAGKTRIARALHARGQRAGAPFVTLNCTALTDAAAAATLFGHVAGTLPATRADRAGLFVEAARGTLLLDNVAELSLHVQAELVRVLQEGEVRPVGAVTPVRIDVRVVATTGTDIEAAVAAGRFHRDLFHLLAACLIRVPPLRDRRQDIPLLVDHFSRGTSERAGRAVTFSGSAIARLRQLDWPGNVRELENVVERLVASARTPVIEANDIGVDAGAGTPAGAHPFADLPTLDELERRYLLYALQRFAGNRTRTAAALGIDRRTLYRMSARLGVPITGAGITGPFLGT